MSNRHCQIFITRKSLPKVLNFVRTVLTLRTRALVLLSKSLFAFIKFLTILTSISQIKWTNTRHVWTLLNAFFIRILNHSITKFQNVDIFYKFVTFLSLSSAHARRIVSINNRPFLFASSLMRERNALYAFENVPS